MNLVIDGYNLIHASPDFLNADQKGEPQQALTSALKIYRAQKKHRITVVFDGGPSAQPSRASMNGIPLVYAGAELSADDVIAKMARKQGAGITVITDDRELAGRCGKHGSQVIGSREFAAALLETAMFEGAGLDSGGDQGWNFSTKKKGPSRRLPKAKRKRRRLKAKL